MPLDFQLHQATLDDLPALQMLIPLSVRGLSGGHYSPLQIASALRHVFGPDTQLITDGTYLVAKAEGRIIGCGGWSRRRTLFGGDQMKTGEDRLLDPASEPARVRAFFIHPDSARCGVGRRLLGACVEAARSHGFQHLELVATLPGEPFYRAAGFEVAEPLDVTLPDGVGVRFVRMTKSLSPPDGAGPLGGAASFPSPSRHPAP